MKKIIVFIIGTVYLAVLLCFTFMPVAQASSKMQDSSESYSSENIQEILLTGDYHNRASSHCRLCDTSRQIVQDMERKAVEEENNILALSTFVSPVFISFVENESLFTYSLSPPVSQFAYPLFELKSHKTIVLRR